MIGDRLDAVIRDFASHLGQPCLAPEPAAESVRWRVGDWGSILLTEDPDRDCAVVLAMRADAASTEPIDRMALPPIEGWRPAPAASAEADDIALATHLIHPAAGLVALIDTRSIPTLDATTLAEWIESLLDRLDECPAHPTIAATPASHDDRLERLLLRA
jgi:hypothetical protein